MYALTLRADGEPLLPFLSDEEESAETAEDEEEEEGEDDGDEVRVAIDFGGIADRLEALPLERGNYRQLSVNEHDVFFLDADEGDFNRFEYRAVGPRSLQAFSLESRETRTVIEGVSDYRLSADGSHVVYEKGEQVGLIEASAEDSSGESLDLAGMKMQYEPAA